MTTKMPQARKVARPTPEGDATVFIVDDDDAMRKAMAMLMKSVGLPTRVYPSAQAFLDEVKTTDQGCLLADVRMPGMSGLDLQEKLVEAGIILPVIMVTAYANVPVAIRAMRLGVSDFIEKPFDDQELIDRVHRAIDQGMRHRHDDEQAGLIKQRIASLTPREHEVMRLVVSGMLNKQVAGELGISQKTVENHRTNVMEKMRVEGLAELVRAALVAGIDLEPMKGDG